MYFEGKESFWQLYFFLRYGQRELSVSQERRIILFQVLEGCLQCELDVAIAFAQFALSVFPVYLQSVVRLFRLLFFVIK